MANITDWSAVLLGCFVAVGFFAFACWFTFHQIRQVAYWPKVPAEILRYWIKRENEHGQPFFHPVIKFTSIGGASVITVTNSGYWRRPWRIGHVIYVRYDPSNPKWAELRTPLHTLFVTVGFFAGSALAAYMAWQSWHGGWLN